MLPKSDHALSHDQLSVKSNFSIFEAEARWLVTFFWKMTIFNDVALNKTNTMKYSHNSAERFG